MITVFTTDHLLRSPRTELYGGELVRPHESPQRAQIVLERIRMQGLGEVIAPARFGDAALLRVHEQGYVEFLKQAWSEWVAAGNRGEAIPDCWPARRMWQRRPNSITGKLGYYAMAGETSISEGTWEAAGAAADVALTAASKLKAGARAAFALCRPPGHHAARDLYGGYCFLNNAAIAAQYLRDTGAARLRSSTSIFIMATALRIFSMSAPTCFTSPCTATPPMRFRTFPVTPTKQERGPAPGRI